MIGKRAKTIICSTVLAGLFFTGTLTPANAKESDESGLKSVKSKQMQNLDIDQIIQIETIRKSYQGLITAYKQKVIAEEKIFNQKLGVNTEEADIREAFDPLAHAMEDVAVCQIRMMQEINQVINAGKQVLQEDGAELSAQATDESTSDSLTSQ